MPNRILPEFWLYDTSINSLRRDPQLFLFRLGLAVDDYWRCAVGPSPQAPHFLRSTLYPCSPDVRVSDVSRWLHECQSAGTLLVRDSDRGWFVEIPEHLRYRREDYSEAQPKYGPRHQREPEQHQLPLGPVGIVQIEAPRRARKASKAPRLLPSPTQVNRSRKQDEVDPESPASASPSEIPAFSEETRKLCQGRGAEEASSAESSIKSPPSDRFQRDEDDLPDDELWQDLCRVLGPREMLQNGALWERRIRTSRRALTIAVQDFLTKPPAERSQYNAAAYITAAHESTLRKAS